MYLKCFLFFAFILFFSNKHQSKLAAFVKLRFFFYYYRLVVLSLMTDSVNALSHRQD